MMKILPLKYRREMSIAKLMFNKLEKNVVSIQEKTIYRIHDRPALVWPEVSNDKLKKHIPHLGPTIWNRLPPDIRNIGDRDTFKTRIKGYYEKKFNP